MAYNEREPRTSVRGQVEGSCHPAFMLFYAYIDRLPEPDRTLFVLELRRFFETTLDGFVVRVKRYSR